MPRVAYWPLRLAIPFDEPSGALSERLVTRLVRPEMLCGDDPNDLPKRNTLERRFDRRLELGWTSWELLR
jgi:hypothetical protein